MSLFPVKVANSFKKHPEEREILRKRSFTEFISKSDPLIKDPLILYVVLEDEGYFLPSKKKFSREWANSFIKEEKDFLKKMAIPNFEPIMKENLDWESVREAIDDPKVNRYFFYVMEFWVFLQNYEDNKSRMV